MKKLYYLILIFILFSCVTGKKKKSNSETEIKLESGIHIDSSTSTVLDEFQRLQNSTHVFSYDAGLSLVPTLDSNGTAQPVSYIEKRQGKPFREIHITGGSLNENTKKEQTETKHEVSSSKYEEVMIKIKTLSETNIFLLEKIRQLDKEKKGFQTAVYVVGGILLILVLIITWLNSKFNKIKKSFKMI